MSQLVHSKEYPTAQIRTIALIGHGGSGKTSFSEASLFSTGIINRQGRVEDGNTVSDYHPDEIERKISINSALLTTEIDGIKINILDTPGYTDFTGEVKASLRVADTAVTFIKSFEGVEVGTEIVWEYVKEYGLPSMFVVNKIDADKSEFDLTVASIKERLSSDAVIITYPVSTGTGFNSVIDVLKMKKLVFSPSLNGKYTEEDLPADQKEKTEKLHEELIEKIAESDEVMLDKFFSNGTLSEEDIKKGLHKGLVDRKVYPIFAGSSTTNIGVFNVLEFVSSYCPPPNELVKVPATNVTTGEEIEARVEDKGDPSLFVFKTVSEHHVGELSFFKVYTGTVTPGLDLVNEANGKPERLGQIFSMNGRDRKESVRIHAGDIGTVVKLKDTHTNNTLSSRSFPVIYRPIVFPEPVITSAIIPKIKGDEEKMGSGLHTLHEEDPTFVFKVDGEIKQTVVSGQGELHLTIITNRLKEKYGVEVELIEPRVPYREAIRGVVADSEFKHKKQSGGRGQYGHVHIKIEPMQRGSGFEFEDAIVGGVVPGRFVPAVEKGVRDVLEHGVIAGYQVVDVKVTLFDGSYHDVDSDEMSFRIAASQAFRKGFKEARPILLEPIYDVEVTVPEEYMGDVMGDLSSRRGKIAGMDTDGSHQIVKATVPLKELYRYSTTLRSMTQGRGHHRQKFSYFDEVPRDVVEKIIAEYKKPNMEKNNIVPDTKKIFFHFSHLAFGEFSSKVFGFMTSVYLARVLGAESFGFIGFVSAVAAYVVLFSNFGIEQYSSRFLSANSIGSNKRFIAIVLSTRFILSLILIIPFLIFGLLYSRSSEQQWYFLFQSFFIIAFSLSLQFFFVASHRTMSIAIVKIITAILVFLFTFLLIHNQSDLPFVSLVSGGMTFVVFLSAMIYVFHRDDIHLLLPGKDDFLKLIRNAGPLGLSAFMVQIYYSADIVFLGFTNPGIELGYYTGAYKIILLFTVIPALIYQIFLPMLAPISENHFISRVTRMYIGILVISGFFICGLLYISADLIIPAVLGRTYYPAVGVFKILVINVFMVFVNVAFANLMIAWDQHKKYFVIVAAGAASNIAANIILIPIYGIYGAAIATVIAESAVFVTAIYYNKKLFSLFTRRES